VTSGGGGRDASARLRDAIAATFAELRLGEAVIHTTLGPPPATCRVKALHLPADDAPRRIDDGARDACEMTVHPATRVPAAKTATRDASEAPSGIDTAESSAAAASTNEVAPPMQTATSRVAPAASTDAPTVEPAPIPDAAEDLHEV